jgi:hypothetical protein
MFVTFADLQFTTITPLPQNYYKHIDFMSILYAVDASYHHPEQERFLMVGVRRYSDESK